MGVMMQAFYWDCPGIENRAGQWWDHVTANIPTLAQVGFTALWLPPVSKAANIGGISMGYDPYDYYDLGDFDQKGTTKTWFGSRAELEALIGAAHDHRMQVYADMVINHNNGGDAETVNGQTRWTRFNPASGLFPRDRDCFHPSPYETTDEMTFGDMPDLCHRNPYVYTELLRYARWMLDTIGFDGFRYDFVKGYGAWMARAIQELRSLRDEKGFRPYGVGECWGSDREIEEWLAEVNTWSDNPVGAFDFPLRYRLKDLCDTFGFSLRDLAAPGTVLSSRPAQAVTFVENHDIVRDNAIVNEKMLAYAYILTHEGYPCVFWQDYFTWDLAQEGNQSGIAALVRAHEAHAGGTTTVLHADDDLYIMQRNGAGDQQGLILVLNNRADWHGTWVQTRWGGTNFRPVAWRGRGDLGTPQEQWSQASGWAELWAPPRGYAVYVPEV
jgi:alpha-amylase